ncbi:Uu.00g001810.m01.CDS01 [Anthostomella pinea]|uniref:Uu.00g001810.m01.CDS01 n=1 Tax=Anthostomella pinea TaxID=933095 RepID=A0AAI8VK26_9PEZI|nr:Uu.00g001810.m01.CDS01 [Anthostomella pinea]
MLDENLPTFYFRQSSDNPLATFLYFSQNGSELGAEYSIQKFDPALPQAKNKYAVAIGDAAAQGVIFAEVLIEPEFQQPTLSAAEIRAQNGIPPSPVPIIPDGFTIQLYNPDQQVSIRGEKSTWTGKESFDFEMPQQSFRLPSSSKLDRQQSDPMASSLTPKIIFKWKRDSKFSKDMTCYMTGVSIGGKKSKEPDITIAMYRHGRQQSVTIYEPNLQRVEVEDRKGLEVVLLLGAEVIREIYLFPSRDSFNLNGAPPNRRKNSRPVAGRSGSPRSDSYAMSGAGGNMAPAKAQSPLTQQPTPPQDARVDAETKRLQAIVQQEERERERQEKEEEERIKKMLDDEERERKQRDEEVARETERLKREFGLEGQDFGPTPSLPTRTTGTPSNQAGPGRPNLQAPQQAPRPSSAGPRPGAFSNWFSPPQPQLQPQPQPQPGRRRGGSGEGKISKKKSTFF